MKVVIGLWLLTIFTLVLKAGESEMKLKVHANCGDEEILSDLDYSLIKNRECLDRIGVKIVVLDKNTDKCGYEFFSKRKSEFIHGIRTDIELNNLIKSFYQSTCPAKSSRKKNQKHLEKP